MLLLILALQSIAHASPGPHLFEFNPHPLALAAGLRFDDTLGPTGNRLAVEENSGRRVDYTFDELYRLTREAIADPVRGNETIRYVYDAVGNRLEKTDHSGTTHYTYDANDRLLTGGADTYAYDANGNTVESTLDGVITTYVYDPQTRLLHALSPAAVLDYAYDADGIRVAKSIDGVESRYVVDANRDYAQVLEEWDAGDAVVVSYTHGDDLISQNRLGLASYYHYDGHGSTQQLTDGAEQVTDQYLFDAFGELLASVGDTPNEYLYTGEPYDPNLGFYFLRARYYNPSIARFHTQDAWMGSPHDPITLHKYLYANANPVMHVDPSGQFSMLDILTSRKVIAVLGGIATATIGLQMFCSPDMGEGPVIWEGMASYFGLGAGLDGIGFGAVLTAKNEKTKRETHIGVAAIFLGVGVGGAAVTNVEEVRFKTPSDSRYFVGTASEKILPDYFSGISSYASSTVKVGISLPAMYCSRIQLDQALLVDPLRFTWSSTTGGIDVGLDWAFGFSRAMILDHPTPVLEFNRRTKDMYEQGGGL